jgi:hypothetical protein
VHQLVTSPNPVMFPVDGHQSSQIVLSNGQVSHDSCEWKVTTPDRDHDAEGSLYMARYTQ